MPRIDCLLVTAQVADADHAALSAAADAECVFVAPADAAAIERALARVDVAFLDGDLDARFLAAPALRWVHCDHAGLERSASPALFARSSASSDARRGEGNNLRLSGAAGRSAPALAEHALYFMLALSYDAPRLIAAQLARRWAPSRHDTRRALTGRSLGIVGLGHIGQALAVRAQALEMRVIGYRRRVAPTPAGVDRVLASDAGETLLDLCAESDIVVLATSLSDRTHHMIDGNAFAAMRPGALLVNVARGGLVDEDALLAALRSGRLAGAGLDSVAREPLPPWSPLWWAPNLLITPHQTPPLADRAARSLAIACENLRRYRADLPLLNEVGPDDVYSHGPTPEGPLARAVRAVFRRMRRLSG